MLRRFLLEEEQKIDVPLQIWPRHSQFGLLIEGYSWGINNTPARS